MVWTREKQNKIEYQKHSTLLQDLFIYAGKHLNVNYQYSIYMFVKKNMIQCHVNAVAPLMHPVGFIRLLIWLFYYKPNYVFCEDFIGFSASPNWPIGNDGNFFPKSYFEESFDIPDLIGYSMIPFHQSIYLHVV